MKGACLVAVGVTSVDDQLNSVSIHCRNQVI